MDIFNISNHAKSFYKLNDYHNSEYHAYLYIKSNSTTVNLNVLNFLTINGGHLGF